MTKAKEEFEVKVVLLSGSSVVLGTFSEAEAKDVAQTAITDGCSKENTYYPVHQIQRVKVTKVENV